MIDIVFICFIGIISVLLVIAVIMLALNSWIELKTQLKKANQENKSNSNDHCSCKSTIHKVCEIVACDKCGKMWRE